MAKKHESGFEDFLLESVVTGRRVVKSKLRSSKKSEKDAAIRLNELDAGIRLLAVDKGKAEGLMPDKWNIRVKKLQVALATIYSEIGKNATKSGRILSPEIMRTTGKASRNLSTPSISKFVDRLIPLERRFDRLSTDFYKKFVPQQRRSPGKRRRKK